MIRSGLDIIFGIVDLCPRACVLILILHAGIGVAVPTPSLDWPIARQPQRSEPRRGAPRTQAVAAVRSSMDVIREMYVDGFDALRGPLLASS